MPPADGLTYKMALEIYLQSAVVKGILTTNQDRLSNCLVLREGQAVVSLTDATLEDLTGNPLEMSSAEYLVYLQEVFLIADLSSQSRIDPAAYAHVYVRKHASKALLNVGPYWLNGNIYLRPGAPLHDLLAATTAFIPVTDASLLNGRGVTPRTYLVNRSKIGCMTALKQ